MVESAVGLVILLFVIFGIIEFGQLVMARMLLNNAATSVSRFASVGEQPATYSDGTPTPSPGGPVTTTFLNTYVTKALAASPLTGISVQFYGSNGNSYIGGTPNRSMPYTSTQFGDGFYVSISGTYVPLFSGNRLYADSSGSTKPMVGSVTLNKTVYVSTEANQ